MKDLDKVKLVELRLLAREYGIKSATKYKKLELIEKLQEAMQKTKIDKSKTQEVQEETKEKESIKKEYKQSKFKHNDKSKKISKKEVPKNDEVKTKMEIETEKAIQQEKKKDGKREVFINKETDAEAFGILEILADGYGFLRGENYISTEKDIYVSPAQIRRFNMKTGDYVKGITRISNNGEKFNALIYVSSINDESPEKSWSRNSFEKLIPIYPEEKLKLEVDKDILSTRVIDIFSPIGKGQRGLIAAPPKVGKTTLIKQIANSISKNYPEIKLIVLLIDERPEEVTDMRESINGEVISSTFDQIYTHHVKVAEMVLNRAQRLVEYNRDVVILLDSITRLARAYNLTINPTGRTLSGGLDPGALHGPKSFFGAARNIRGGGSLTILGTGLIDTGSRMDDVIFEEFKGTGNMELHLDRKLYDKRVFPAIDIYRSGTRKEELLLNDLEREVSFKLRRAMTNENNPVTTERILAQLKKSKDNNEFLEYVKNIKFENKKINK